MDFFEIYMAHDQQKNTGTVQKGRLHSSLDREYLILVHDVLVLFMFFLMADLT